MGAFIGSMITIIIASFIAYFAKKRIEDTFFIAFAFISFTLYIFGIMGTLSTGVIATVIISLICLLIFAVHLTFNKNKFRTKKENVVRYVLTPGFVVFIFLTVFFVILNYGREYYLNDEFSHWGLSIKNMFALDELYCVQDSSDTFKDYPPFATLICYFWSAVTGGFNESYTFTGMGLLMFSCLLPAFKVFSFKDKKTLGMVPLFVSLCFVITASLKLSAFTILAVDTLMALIPVYIFLIHFIKGRDTAKNCDMCITDIIFIAIALAALTMTKGIGIGFSIYVVLLLAADILIFNRQSKVSKKILLLVGSAFAIIAASVSWKTVLKISSYVPDGDGTQKTLQNLCEMIFRTDEMLPYRKQTVDSFIGAAFEGRFAFGVSLCAIFIVFVFLSVLLVISVRKERKKMVRYAILLSSMIIAFVLYLKAILYTFAYKFTEYEAVNLASYERYIGTFLTMWLFFIVILYLKEYYYILTDRLFCTDRPKICAAKKVCVTISWLSVCALILFYAFVYPYTAKSSAEHRDETDHAAVIGRLYDTLKEQETYVDASEVRICYVTTLEENRDYLVANYNAAPFVLSFDKELPENIITQYDYLYVDSSCTEDVQSYVSYRTLYKVISDNGKYVLKPVYTK